LKNGEYTYLSSGEIAIDTGKAYQKNFPAHSKHITAWPRWSTDG